MYNCDNTFLEPVNLQTDDAWEKIFFRNEHQGNYKNRRFSNFTAVTVIFRNKD
jgi:hypothetical protein